MLEAGARMEEPYLRPECELTSGSLAAIWVGKDASINDMFVGGNGFFVFCFVDYQFEVVFDMGCHQEQRDFKSLSTV